MRIQDIMRNSAHTDNTPPFIEEGDDNKITHNLGTDLDNSGQGELAPHPVQQLPQVGSQQFQYLQKTGSSFALHNSQAVINWKLYPGGKLIKTKPNWPR